MLERLANRLRRGTGSTLVLALLSTCAIPLLAHPAHAQEQYVNLGEQVQQVNVAPNSTVTITTSKAFGDLVVGSADLIDVVPLSDRSLFIRAKKNGATNISVYDAKSKLVGVIDVQIESDFSEVSAAIRSAAPNSKVRVINSNNRIRLTGTVRDAVELQRVMEVAQSYTPDLPVMNQLRVAESQQVMLEVRVMEASRQSGTDLGIGWRLSDRNAIGTASTRAGVGVNDKGRLNTTFNGGVGATTNAVPFGTLVAKVMEVSGTRVDAVISALEQRGLVRRLAQPNLIAMSGETASFHAGGEVPIQTVSNSNGTVATQTDYRPYGVRLKFTPQVLDDGLIHLQVESEVSELDTTVNVNGNPGFISRAAKTTIQLRDSQSFALAGLLNSVNAKDIQQLPWLGDIPILGALFRSTSYQKKETDLVIVVTPHLVRPAAAGEMLASPLDHTRSSNEYELFALGLLEVDRDMLKKFRDGDGIVGPYGHRLDLDLGGQVAVTKK